MNDYYWGKAKGTKHYQLGSYTNASQSHTQDAQPWFGTKKQHIKHHITG